MVVPSLQWCGSVLMGLFHALWWRQEPFPLVWLEDSLWQCLQSGGALLCSLAKGIFSSYCGAFSCSGVIFFYGGLEVLVGTQKCHFFIHFIFHYFSHFIVPLTFYHTISIHICGFHLIISTLFIFSIRS